MNRCLRLFCCLDGQQTANGMSLSVAFLAILFLHLESAPTPAGADVARKTQNKSRFVMAQAAPVAGAAGAVQQVEPGQPELSPEERTEKELLAKIQLIEKGIEFLTRTPDYTASFVKQELVNGSLLDEQEMEMKVRHAPFSVYMKWVTGEPGREIVYVDGHNNGKMTAHPGGWKAKLPALWLEPTSHLAMAESRYPVTKVGLFELAKLMREVHHEDLKKKRVARCERLQEQVFDGRPCHAFLIEYKDAKSSETYRKSISLIDKEWSIPVYTRNFGWLNGDVPPTPEEHDAATLVEFYSYSTVKFGSNLLALDFDHTNEEYRFKRQ